MRRAATIAISLQRPSPGSWQVVPPGARAAAARACRSLHRGGTGGGRGGLRGGRALQKLPAVNVFRGERGLS